MNAAQTKVKELEAEIASCIDLINKLDKQLAETLEELSERDKYIDELEAKIEEQRAELDLWESGEMNEPEPFYPDR